MTVPFPRYPRIAGPAVACLAAFAYCLAFRRYGVNLEDEGTLLAQAYRVYGGQIPYRDFHTGYTPGVFYLNAGLFALFGASIGVVRVGLAVVHAAALGLLVYIAAHVLRPWLVLGAALLVVGFLLPVAPGGFCTFNIPYPAWYATLWGFLALACLLRQDTRPAGPWLFLPGLAWGAAFCFKQNTAIFGLAGSLFYLVLRDAAPPRTKTRWPGAVLSVAVLLGATTLLRQHLSLTLAAVFLAPILPLAVAATRARPTHGLLAGAAWLVAGFSTPVVPLLATLTAAAGFIAVGMDALQLGSDTALVYYVPYPRLADAAAAVSAAPTVARAVRVVTEYLFFLTLPVVHLLSTLRLARHAKTRGNAFTLLACTSPLVYLSVYPRMDYWHLLAIGGLAMILVLLVIQDVADALTRRGLAALAGMLTAAPLVLAVIRVAPNMGPARALFEPPASPMGAPVERADLRWDLLTRDYLRAVPGVVAALDGARSVFGFPALGLFNFLTGVPTPVRHDYFFPGRPHPAEDAVVLATLHAMPPDRVVILDAPLGFFPDAFAAHRDLVQYLTRCFRVLQKVGPYRILEETDPPCRERPPT